jgi:hypothetical protein
VAGHGDALEQSVAAALSANDEALLADYVRRHATQPERPVETDAGSRPPLNLSSDRPGPARNPMRRTDR